MRSSRRVSSLTAAALRRGRRRRGWRRRPGIGGRGGAACATTRKTMSVRPIVTVESGGSAASTTLRPFSRVPLVEFMSRTMARSPSHRISTCLRLVPESAIVMSASLPRPMTVRDLTSGCRLPSTSTTPRHATRPSAVERVDAERAGRELVVALERDRHRSGEGVALRLGVLLHERVELVAEGAAERAHVLVVGGREAHRERVRREDAVAAHDRRPSCRARSAARRRSRQAGCRCGRSSRTRCSRRARDPSRSCQVVPHDSSGRGCRSVHASCTRCGQTVKRGAVPREVSPDASADRGARSRASACGGVVRSGGRIAQCSILRSAHLLPSSTRIRGRRPDSRAAKLRDILGKLSSLCLRMLRLARVAE